MKYQITEGKTYKIVGATDGTVTDASGNVIISYTAGEEVTFVAPAGDYVNINPSGNILSNYATISYVDEALNGIDLSDYATTAQLSNYATITYVDEAIAAGGGGGSFDMAAYNAFYGKYYNCTTVNEVSTINSDYKNDLTYKGGWIYDLGKLTNGSSMFHSTSLQSFNCDLSSLIYGNYMFYNTALESFNVDLSKLTNGNSMFQRCTNLTEWNIPLTSLTNGFNMFNGCSNLTSFEGDLSKLTNGWNMFANCSNLTSFSGDLSSLSSGQSMFYNCKLDAASVERILTTIPTKTDNATLFQLHFSSEAAAKFEEITGVTPTTTEQTVIYKGWEIDAKIND